MSDDNYASDCRFSSPEMSPLLPATSDQMSPSTDNGGEDIEWNTGHINPMASIYLPMPTADSTSITDAVERYIKEHGAPVDWQEVSRQTGFPVFYCLENNLCSQDKSWWTYSMETFDWRLAESLRMFIQEHYPAPKEINFVAVSNFTWIVIADCILLYNSLCGEYEWTTASLNRASRLSNEGWTNAQIARYLSPTMGGSRVAQVLPQSKSRELAALPPPEMDEGSIEVVRTLVMAASGSAKDVDVPGMMESARQALAHLDSHMVDKCTLAILSTHPSFAARRPPRRSTSTNARAAPQGAQQPAPSTSSGIRTCRWSKEETLLLTSYVQTTEGTRNWRYFASVIATKSLSQCQNKFRSLNTTKKKLN
ncbi:hypothetical protein GGF46_001824 [Coemansia sp. RSA 552]|nr:hypothetical protein GGF46_001824 [Coemansia sp. RSA 552]